VDVFLLAKNTGTSSDMIERFYGQVKLERMARVPSETCARVAEDTTARGQTRPGTTSSCGFSDPRTGLAVPRPRCRR
jgi:hypothetical protein